MKTTSADLLEFESLRQLLLRYVSSPLGQREVMDLRPRTDLPWIEERLSEVAEAMEYLRSASQPTPASRGAATHIRFDSFPDPSEILSKLRVEGTCLEPNEMLALTALLDGAADVRRLLLAVTGRFPKLGARAAQLGDFRALLKDMAGKILPDGSVADDASVALARLRREVEKQRKLIQESLERFLRQHQEDGVLQEDFVAIRNERFVVPIISGRQRKLDGIVHGSSGTGHTLFVEPMETVALNNELVRVVEEELQEVHRILRELTERLREQEPSIRLTAEVFGQLELLFGLARFGVGFGCAIPRFSPPSNRRLLLRDARHPLLEDVLRKQKKPIVPISLTLDDGRSTLLISGPNTGGKTVTLKTVGLLALMAQSALPVPCAEAEFPLFREVLADIGDNQSILESLSTFSAHMTRIRDMVGIVTPDSLVLLDELGRATDPEEGGALGVAVIDHIRSRGTFSLASTHLLALKMYGAHTEGVLNGSMGFDEDTLEPTYILSLGVPGKSAGLEIARRLGLPEALISSARGRLGNRDRDVGQFLSELHRRLDEAAVHQQALQQREEALTARERELVTEWTQRETKKLKELERRCDLVIDRFERQAEQTIQQILQDPGQKRAQQQALRRVAKAKRELREEMETTVLSTRDEARQGELPTGPLSIHEGVRVRLRGIREPARVRRKLNDSVIEVDAGLMKMQISVDEVLEVLPAAPVRGLPTNVSFQASTQPAESLREINVIGQHAEEACSQVEKFLDNAVLAEITHVRIVHGHGMGILRRAIAELLAENPNVEKYYPAQQHDGGAGATVVELKG